MADLQKTVEIIFGGRNDLSKVIGNVERSLDSLNGASKPFADMADNALKAETAVIGLGVAFAGLSITEAGNFFDQFSEISTLIETDKADLGGYSQDILDYATNSTQSLESINAAVYSAISAGTDYTKSLALLSTAEKLAVAGKSDLSTTLVALASTMNAYGASTDEAAKYSDTFFTTVKMGQTTIPELSTSLSQVTSTAVAAGVPFDDLSASIAALTASGMPTTQAVTSIKAALTNIIKPSADAQKAARDLGIEFNSTALKTQGLGGFMQKLYEATGGNIDTMAKLFGSTEALSGVMTLAADKSGIFAKSLDAMKDSSGATDLAFKKMVDGFVLNNQRLVNNLKVVLIGVGGKLLDEYGDIIDSLVDTLKGIGTSIQRGDLDGMINVFESAMGDISKLLAGVAKVLPEALKDIKWDALESSFDSLKKSLGGAFDAVFGDIDLGTVDGVREAIQKLVKLMAGLTYTSSGVIDGMRPLFDFLGTVADKFGEMDKESQKAAGQILGFGKTVHETTGLLSGATDAIGGFGNGILVLGGTSMLSSVTSITTALGLSGLAGALIAVSAAAATWGVGESVKAGLDGVVKAFSDQGSLDELMHEWVNPDQPFLTRAEIEKKIIGDDKTLISAVIDEIFGSDDEVKKAGEKLTNDVMEPIEKLPEEIKIVARSVAEIGWEIDADGNIVAEIDKIKNSIAPLPTEFEKLAGVIRKDMGVKEIKGTFSVISTGATDVAGKLDDATKATDNFKLKMAEISSNEKTKTMELAVDLNIASLESDTKKFTALMDTISTSVTSTGDTLSSLSGTLGGFDSTRSSGYDNMLDLVKAEEKRRDDALQLQKDQAKAEIKLANAKTKALKSGDSLITISGDGLAPELEAFMWKILETIQIRAAEDESALLLGI